MSRSVNILFLGGAKRVSIGRMFIDAGRRMGFEVKLFSYELESHVPVSVIAEIIIGLRWRDPEQSSRHPYIAAPTVTHGPHRAMPTR